MINQLYLPPSNNNISLPASLVPHMSALAKIEPHGIASQQQTKRSDEGVVGDAVEIPQADEQIHPIRGWIQGQHITQMKHKNRWTE